MQYLDGQSVLCLVFAAGITSCVTYSSQEPGNDTSDQTSTPAPSPAPPTLVVSNLDSTLSAEIINRVTDVFYTVYPMETARFNPDAARIVTVIFDPNNTGVAYATGTEINISSTWLISYPYDVDVMTHEAMHVVQHYSGLNSPGWAVEGLADFARDAYGIYNTEAGWTLGDYESGQNYTDSYRVTARFFKWLDIRLTVPILEDLDAIIRSGHYSDDFWIAETTYTIDELWSQYTNDSAL